MQTADPLVLGKYSRLPFFLTLPRLAGAWEGHHAAYCQESADYVFAVCSRLIPSDVKLTVEQTFAGLSGDDYALLKEIVFAIRQAIPDASSQPPGKVLAHVLGACSTVRRRKRTVLFAQVKFVNDLKG